MKKPRPKAELTSKQRSYLRGLGHALEPVVQIGHQGLTPGIFEAVAEALGHHELIKVRVGKNAPDPDPERGPLKEALSAEVGCHIVQSVGRVLLVYRQNKDPDERRIKLPVLVPAPSKQP